MILIELALNQERGGLFLDIEDTETRVFRSMKKAARWLRRNGFYFDDEDRTWHHENDELWKFVDVDVSEYTLDDNSDSKFKNFKKVLSPWARAARMDAFFEFWTKQGLDRETISKMYEERFEEINEI